MTKYKVCNKCKGFDYKKVINEIKKIDNNAEFEIGCQNFCGIGRFKPFIILNNKPIIGENIEDLINKIKQTD